MRANPNYKFFGTVSRTQRFEGNVQNLINIDYAKAEAKVLSWYTCPPCEQFYPEPSKDFKQFLRELPLSKTKTKQNGKHR